ncbi:MAG: DNA helicase UvrD, partial [Pseudomonas sp.]|nr:DNA helicase UvrD [Pseudomonas sp.]
MLSAVKRYKLLVSSALARCFPRTSAYVQSEDDLILRRWPDAGVKSGGKSGHPGKKVRKAKSAAKPTRLADTAASTAPKVASKPRTKARKPAGDGIYGPAKLCVNEQQIQAMRLRVGRA